MSKVVYFALTLRELDIMKRTSQKRKEEKTERRCKSVFIKFFVHVYIGSQPMVIYNGDMGI